MERGVGVRTEGLCGRRWPDLDQAHGARLPQRQGAASLPPRPLGLPLLWCISPFHQVLVVEEPSRSDHFALEPNSPDLAPWLTHIRLRILSSGSATPLPTSMRMSIALPAWGLHERSGAGRLPCRPAWGEHSRPEHSSGLRLRSLHPDFPRACKLTSVHASVFISTRWEQACLTELTGAISECLHL